MGIFSPFNKRNAYVPPSDAADSSTLLTGADPNLVRVSGGTDPETSHDDVQLARQPTQDGQGVAVELPDGARVPDRRSATGKLMSPVSDLSDVAKAGRDTAQTYRKLSLDPLTRETAGQIILRDYFRNIGTGGKYDYQREGNQVFGHIFGIAQKPQFRNVSNVNVGLFAHQAGMTLEETLKEAGEYRCAQYRRSSFAATSWEVSRYFTISATLTTRTPLPLRPMGIRTAVFDVVPRCCT